MKYHNLKASKTQHTTTKLIPHFRTFSGYGVFSVFDCLVQSPCRQSGETHINHTTTMTIKGSSQILIECAADPPYVIFSYSELPKPKPICHRQHYNRAVPPYMCAITKVAAARVGGAQREILKPGFHMINSKPVLINEHLIACFEEPEQRHIHGKAPTCSV